MEETIKTLTLNFDALNQRAPKEEAPEEGRLGSLNEEVTTNNVTDDMAKVNEADTERRMLASALFYINQGWAVCRLERTVIDQLNSGKAPIGKSWQTHVLQDCEIAEAWDCDDPENVGIICGFMSNLIVVDTDKPEHFTDVLARHPEMADTYTVARDNAPRGRCHRYFTLAEGQAVPAFVKGLWGELQTTGHQVVAPPSMHWTGHRYQVTNDVAPLPWKDEYMATLAPPRANTFVPTTPVAEQRLPLAPPTSRDVEDAINHIAHLPAAISGDDGSGSCMAVCHALVVGFDLTDAEATQVLQDHYQPRCLDTAGNPAPWTDKEIAHKLASARENKQGQVVGYLRTVRAPEAVRVAGAKTDDALATNINPGSVQAIKLTLYDLQKECKGEPARYQAKATAAVITWLHIRGEFYYQADDHRFAGVMYFDSERKLLLHVQSDEFLAWLSDTLGINRSERLWAFVKAQCETEGLSARSTGITPAIYWHGTKTAFYLSCGPGHIVKIAAGSVSLVDNGTDDVLFTPARALKPWKLVEPVNPFATMAIFNDSAVDSPYGRDLIMAWATSLASNPRAKPPLCISGAYGGGKTTIVVGIDKLYGLPPRIAKMKEERVNEDSFWVSIDAGGLLCMDNADTDTKWLPDALAAASTGGTNEKRRLYTDRDSVTLNANAWIAVTTTNPTFAADPGLADRLVVVRSHRRVGATEESALYDEIEAGRDAGLSWIAQTLAKALADTMPVPEGLNARHPDFARLAAKIGRAAGRGDEMLYALRSAEEDKSRFHLENDPLGAVLLEVLKSTPLAGTAKDICLQLRDIDSAYQFSPTAMSKQLLRLWPCLEKVFLCSTGMDSHTKVKTFDLRPDPTATSAGVAGVKTPIPEKSPHDKKLEDFCQNAQTTPATPANQELVGGQPKVGGLPGVGGLKFETLKKRRFFGDGGGK